jgi:hypothetical protein
MCINKRAEHAATGGATLEATVQGAADIYRSRQGSLRHGGRQTLRRRCSCRWARTAGLHLRGRRARVQAHACLWQALVPLRVGAKDWGYGRVYTVAVGPSRFPASSHERIIMPPHRYNYLYCGSSRSQRWARRALRGSQRWASHASVGIDSRHAWTRPMSSSGAGHVVLVHGRGP